MKLTLAITCQTYELARALFNYLGQVGFSCHVSSPSSSVYEVVVTWRLQVNGAEVENAARLAKDYLLDHQ